MGEGTRLLGRRGYGMEDDGVTPSWENAASSCTSCFPWGRILVLCCHQAVEGFQIFAGQPGQHQLPAEGAGTSGLPPPTAAHPPAPGMRTPHPQAWGWWGAGHRACALQSKYTPGTQPTTLCRYLFAHVITDDGVFRLENALVLKGGVRLNRMNLLILARV